MKAIRGATTVAVDNKEEIKTAVKELLFGIVNSNSLNLDDIVCILFSNTADITSYYPAKAAREAGFYGCALYSSLEPAIDGALPLCIRALVLAETDKKPVHVYLRGAKGLRKDITKVYNVAIDGPAGSGKSTVSKMVGKRLNILCLDTGAMYRACALKCIKCGADLSDEAEVAKIMENLDLEVAYSGGAQVTKLDGADVSGEIRTQPVSMAASKVSALGCVRQKMVALQRKIAAGTSCVLDGRDIGTNVLPGAEFKFYLTASPEVRAERRAAELEASGTKADITRVLAEIKQRDLQDTTRKIAPLKVADDAVVIDTSNMTAEEVAAFIESKIQEKI